MTDTTLIGEALERLKRDMAETAGGLDLANPKRRYSHVLVGEKDLVALLAWIERAREEHEALVRWHDAVPAKELIPGAPIVHAMTDRARELLAEIGG